VNLRQHLRQVDTPRGGAGTEVSDRWESLTAVLGRGGQECESVHFVPINAVKPHWERYINAHLSPYFDSNPYIRSLFHGLLSMTKAEAPRHAHRIPLQLCPYPC
jgi:hypothetical protein